MAEAHVSESSAPKLDLSRFAPAAGVIGLVGTIGCLAMMFGGQEKMWGSFLFGWYFWMSISIGMLGLTFLHHAVRGQWTLAILRLLEAGAGWRTFLLMLVLIIPVLMQPQHLYEWTDKLLVYGDPAKGIAGDATILRKTWWLNEPGWIARTFIVLLMFAWMSWGFQNSCRRQEANKDFKLEAGRSSYGAVSLVFFFLACTVLLTDLLMSMNPHWSSTMYPVWQIIAGGGAALAFCLLIQCTQADKKPYTDVLRSDLTRDQGNMMFALTMFWGYTSISQFLIIWNGNIPETTSYFVQRSSAIHPPGMEGNHWGVLGLLLIVGRFFVPWFLLLAPRSKTNVSNLAKITGWILVMHLCDMYLLVIPSVHGRGVMGPLNAQLPFDLLAVISVGGLWLGMFAFATKSRALIPTYDQRLQEAKAHAH